MHFDNLSEQYRLREWLPVPDPFGIGITFHLRPASNKDFRGWVRSQRKDDSERRMLQEFRDLLPEKEAARVIRERVEKRHRNGDDEENRAEALGAGVKHLLAGWEGPAVEEVPYSEEALAELIDNDVPIGALPETRDGLQVGDIKFGPAAELGTVLPLWLASRAAEVDRFRAEEVEEAGEA